jgi:hypothetical protein
MAKNPIYLLSLGENTRISATDWINRVIPIVIRVLRRDLGVLVTLMRRHFAATLPYDAKFWLAVDKLNSKRAPLQVQPPGAAFFFLSGAALPSRALTN